MLIYSHTFRRGFTLIEVMISIVLFSGLLIGSFSALAEIAILRTRVSSEIDLSMDLYNTSELLFSFIKDGGRLDFEEYWNRHDTLYDLSAGHYSNLTGYGNYGIGSTVGDTTFGDGFYYCTNIPADTYGCVQTGPQRYGEYAFQFYDYHGDTNADGSIRFDDDDEDKGQWPSVFDPGMAFSELYLIRLGTRNERTYFRRIVRTDPNAPPWVTCDTDTGEGAGCIGNIQILRMVGRDHGFDHNGTGPGVADGIVDTWECHPDYYCSPIGTSPLATGADEEWVDIFPDTVNVREFTLYPYPNKSDVYAWQDDTATTFIQHYVRVVLRVGYSWKKRQVLGSINPEILLTTTINLNQK